MGLAAGLRWHGHGDHAHMGLLQAVSESSKPVCSRSLVKLTGRAWFSNRDQPASRCAVKGSQGSRDIAGRPGLSWQAYASGTCTAKEKILGVCKLNQTDPLPMAELRCKNPAAKRLALFTRIVRLVLE